MQGRRARISVAIFFAHSACWVTLRLGEAGASVWASAVGVSSERGDPWPYMNRRPLETWVSSRSNGGRGGALRARLLGVSGRRFSRATSLEGEDCHPGRVHVAFDHQGWLF
jgi:hypothetical protein